MTYRSIAHRDHADTGYGFSGYTDLAIREDGKRFRMCTAGFAWHGNEGGYNEYPSYGDLADARAFWSEHFGEHSELTESEFFAALPH